MVQLLLLNVFWIFSLLCYVIQYIKKQKNPNEDVSNLVSFNWAATISDVALAINDWLFFEQYFGAALILPIALNLQLDDKTYEKKQGSREKLILVVRVIYYAILSAWFITSLIVNQSVFRLSECVLNAVSTTIFVGSLLVIKRELANLENSQQEDFLQNKCLIQSYIAICILEIFLYLATYIFAFETKDYSANGYELKNESECHELVVVGILYILL